MEIEKEIYLLFFILNPSRELFNVDHVFAMSLLEINSLSQKSLDRIDILHILTVLP